MRIICQTNVDLYPGRCWPIDLKYVPRIGENVQVVSNFISHFRDQSLPTYMEVVNVIYSETEVRVELWYSELSTRAAELAGTKLL